MGRARGMDRRRKACAGNCKSTFSAPGSPARPRPDGATSLVDDIHGEDRGAFAFGLIIQELRPPVDRRR
jgi:hypothetical protein